MSDVQDEVVIVTGASKGLGRSMALHLTTLGAKVVLVSRSRDNLESVAATADNETLVAPADVRDSTDVKNVVDSAIEEFGRVDALVNNAGVDFLSFGNERKPIVDTSEEEWDTILGVNLKGVFLFSKYAAAEMIDQGSGNIVNISSGLGRRAKPNAVPYTASKWGLEGFTQGLSLEVEDEGVNVNALDPGGQVSTQIWDHLPEEKKAEILDPDVMNEAAALLVSQGPDGVTGKSMTAQEWEQYFD
jgi:3-oxoacyl-[acyl-carrier protein] reductase